MPEKLVVYIDPDLEEIVPRYLQNKEREVQEIRNALGRDDFETVRILGHSMKGSGGGYGFDGITDIGAIIETAAKARDRAAIDKELDRLADYLGRVEVIYRAE